MKLIYRLAAWYAAFCKVAEKLCSPLLLAVRLYWGWQFVQTGWGKLHNQARITDFFTSLNIPFPALNAHFVSGLEFFGGILLILGLASRPDRVPAHRIDVCCLLDSRSRGTLLDLQQSRQILWSRSLYLSLCCDHDSILWAGPLFAGCSHREEASICRGLNQRALGERCSYRLETGMNPG